MQAEDAAVEIVQGEAIEFTVTNEVSVMIDLANRTVQIVRSQDDELEPETLYDDEQGWDLSALKTFSVVDVLSRDDLFGYCAVAGLQPPI